MGSLPLGINSQAGDNETGGVGSDSKDRRRTYREGNNGIRATPRPYHLTRDTGGSFGMIELGRNRIDHHDAVFHLTLRRRYEGRRAHAGPVHWTGHISHLSSQLRRVVGQR